MLDGVVCRQDEVGGIALLAARYSSNVSLFSFILLLISYFHLYYLQYLIFVYIICSILFSFILFAVSYYSLYYVGRPKLTQK
jgi:uncharacterized membrane protein (DUF106 family)